MTIEEHRNRPADRRHGIDSPEPPFKDKDGQTVIEDRRITPDRRINNIEVEWAEDVDNDTNDEPEKTA